MQAVAIMVDGNSLIFIGDVLGSNICKDIKPLDFGFFSALVPNAKYYFKRAASSHFSII